MLNAISELLRHRWTWRVTGFVSSIVGFYCYALSPSAQYLIGAWSLVKIVGYSLVSALVCTSTLLVDRDRCRWARGRGPIFKTQLCFAVLMITSVFSFLEDRSEEGKKESGYGKTMNVISGAAFASMAMSFSMELELGFEVGVTNFMIGWLLVRAMKVRLMIAIVATLFCYMLLNLRYIPRILSSRRGATHGEDADGMNTQSQSIHQDTDSVPNSDSLLLRRPVAVGALCGRKIPWPLSSSMWDRINGVNMENGSKGCLFDQNVGLRMTIPITGGTISSKSVKQTLTTTSTMEAEYIACYKATCQVVWLKNLISAFHIV